MPEGPEVRIVAEQLDQWFAHEQLNSVERIGGRYLKNPVPGLSVFETTLPATLTCVASKGKLIGFYFDNGWFLFSSLGMTGSWGEVKEKHSAVQFNFSNGSAFYTDPRRFGRLEFLYGSDAADAKFDSLGPDLVSVALGIDPAFRTSRFCDCFENSSKTIVEDLMNQKIVSGVGNYIKSEALYRARISPWRQTSSLNTEEWKGLFTAIKQIMVESYKAGGATLATYKHLDGSTGGYSEKLKVYGKFFDPEKRLIQKETTKDGRTTWWVPEVQK